MGNKYKPSGKYAEKNPNPVLSSSLDGDIHFMNASVMKALRNARLTHVYALLPANHNDLVAICANTGSPATSDRSVNGYTFIWSYQPVPGEKEVYIYGYDVTDYQTVSHNSVSEESLVYLYELTPAEVRLTRHLLNGDTLKESATKQGVAITTVRSHLKAVFQKTGTSRQSELIRCILMNHSADVLQLNANTK